jgi:hypothetical protein
MCVRKRLKHLIFWNGGSSTDGAAPNRKVFSICDVKNSLPTKLKIICTSSPAGGFHNIAEVFLQNRLLFIAHVFFKGV